MTTGAIRCAKFQSNRHPPTNQHPTFYMPDALPVAQPIVAQKHTNKALTGKRLAADFTFLHAVVEMSPDVLDVCSLRPQLHRTQLALEQLAVDLVNVVLVLGETVLVRRHKVALITRVRLGGRVTCVTQQDICYFIHSVFSSDSSCAGVMLLVLWLGDRNGIGPKYISHLQPPKVLLLIVIIMPPLP